MLFTFVCVGSHPSEVLSDYFNSWFGSNVTFIANAYSREPHRYVWVCFHATVLRANMIELALQPSIGRVSVEARWKSLCNDQLIMIPFQEHHRQHRRRRETYINMTVISDEGELLFSNFEIRANASYVITRDRRIIRQKYGSSNLFQDEYGTDHISK